MGYHIRNRAGAEVGGCAHLARCRVAPVYHAHAPQRTAPASAKPRVAYIPVFWGRNNCEADFKEYDKRVYAAVDYHQNNPTPQVWSPESVDAMVRAIQVLFYLLILNRASGDI